MKILSYSLIPVLALATLAMRVHAEVDEPSKRVERPRVTVHQEQQPASYVVTIESGTL